MNLLYPKRPVSSSTPRPAAARLRVRTLPRRQRTRHRAGGLEARRRPRWSRRVPAQAARTHSGWRAETGRWGRARPRTCPEPSVRLGPRGTRNHFARDLGVPPSELVAALDAFADGVERRIDLGDVNGRLFLNNVTLGIYALACSGRAIATPKSARCSRRPGGARGRAGSCPRRGSSTTSASRTPIPPWLSCPTTLRPAAAPGAGDAPALDGGRLGVLLVHGPGGPRRRPGRAWTARSLRLTAAESVGRRRRRRGRPSDPAASFRKPAAGASRLGFPRPHAHQLTRTSTSTPSPLDLLSPLSRTSSATGTVTSWASLLGSASRRCQEHRRCPPTALRPAGAKRAPRAAREQA